MAELELATRGQRLGAAIIDGLIVLGVTLTIVALIGVNSIAERQGFVDYLLRMTASGLIFLGINWHFLTTRGQTVGKKLMGIKIVSTSGGLVPIKDLLLRRYAPVWGLGLIPIIGGLLSLVDVLFIFRGDKRCIHDLIADTKVVRA